MAEWFFQNFVIIATPTPRGPRTIWDEYDLKTTPTPPPPLEKRHILGIFGRKTGKNALKKDDWKFLG